MPSPGSVEVRASAPARATAPARAVVEEAWPVVVVVTDAVRDQAAVLWGARYAAATATKRPHLQPRDAGRGHGRRAVDLEALVRRVAPQVQVVWEPPAGGPSPEGPATAQTPGLLVVTRWCDGRSFAVPDADCTVVVVPESSRGGAAGVAVVGGFDQETGPVVAAARSFTAVLRTSLLVLSPSEVTRASRHAELLVVGTRRARSAGTVLPALAWSTRQVVAVVPEQVGEPPRVPRRQPASPER